jgi:G patch domain-containing protein 1
LDVYDHDHRSSRQRVAYDHINGDEDDTVVIGGRLSKQKASIPVCIKHISRSIDSIIDIHKRPSSSIQHFRDGRPVLAGFILSDQPVAEDRW